MRWSHLYISCRFRVKRCRKYHRFAVLALLLVGARFHDRSNSNLTQKIEDGIIGGRLEVCMTFREAPGEDGVGLVDAERLDLAGLGWAGLMELIA
jgi:hypothetical protein